jgi:hypothetical protein
MLPIQRIPAEQAGSPAEFFESWGDLPVIITGLTHVAPLWDHAHLLRTCPAHSRIPLMNYVKGLWCGVLLYLAISSSPHHLLCHRLISSSPLHLFTHRVQPRSVGPAEVRGLTADQQLLRAPPRGQQQSVWVRLRHLHAGYAVICCIQLFSSAVSPNTNSNPLPLP